MNKKTYERCTTDTNKNKYHSKKPVGRAPRYDWDHVTPTTFGEHNLLVKRLNLEDLVEKIDWTPFFHFLGI